MDFWPCWIHQHGMLNAVAYSVKRVLNGHSQKGRKLVFKTNYSLMQVKSIAECSKGSILQYFRPSLSYHLSLRPLFCLYLSGFTVSCESTKISCTGPYGSSHCPMEMSRDMRFPTMWNVRPAKAQTSLRIRAV